MKHITTILAALFLSLSLPAQSYELGIYPGLSFYEGELAPAEFLTYVETIRPAFGFFGRAHVNDYIAFRAGYNRLKVMGDDEISGGIQGLAFESNINELYATMEITPFYFSLFRGATPLAPYAYGGGAFFTFNPTREWNGQTVELQPLGTEAQGQPGYKDPYELQSFAIVFGVGLKWLLSDRWTLSAEYGARKTFTDHLDDASSARLLYGDVMQNGSLAAELSYPNLDPDTADPSQVYRRGGPKPDWYFTGGFTLSYLFGYSGRGPRRSGGRSKMGCYQF